jgi:anti-sigma factor RsiW
MANDENSQRDELDAALTARLRAVRPSMPVPDAAGDEPSDDEILRYVDGSMDDGERGAFETRLADHPSSAARVAIVAESLAEGGWGPAPKADPVGRRAVNLASRFVFRLSDGVLSFLRGTDLPRGMEPAMAVRSAAPAQPQSFFEFVSQYPFESGDVDARLALEPVAQQAIDVQLEITQAGAPLEGVRVKLLRDGRPVDSAPTEKGRCHFSALTAARYEFEIRKGGTEVGRMVLDIRGDGTA